jgi:hypothetical protein
MVSLEMVALDFVGKTTKSISLCIYSNNEEGLIAFVASALFILIDNTNKLKPLVSCKQVFRMLSSQDNMHKML